MDPTESVEISRQIYPSYQAVKREKVYEWALQREIANAPLSASLSNSPTYKIRLLIHNKKGVLNLVESGEDVTMREK